MTDPVKAKLIELVPEIMARVEKYSAFEGGDDIHITLADVLRAIHKADPPMKVNVGIEGEVGEEGVLALWYVMGDGEIIAVHFDLTTDYDNQTQEVKDFIGKLLNV